MFKKIIILCAILAVTTACSHRIYHKELTNNKKVGILVLTSENFVALHKLYKSEHSYDGSEEEMYKDSYSQDISKWKMNQYIEEAAMASLADTRFETMVVNVNKSQYYDKMESYHTRTAEGWEDKLPYLRYSDSCCRFVQDTRIARHFKNIKADILKLVRDNELDSIIIIMDGHDVNDTNPPVISSYGMVKTNYMTTVTVEPYVGFDVLMYDVNSDQIYDNSVGKYKYPRTEDRQTVFDYFGPKADWKSPFSAYTKDEQDKLEEIMKEISKKRLEEAFRTLGVI